MAAGIGRTPDINSLRKTLMQYAKAVSFRPLKVPAAG